MSGVMEKYEKIAAEEATQRTKHQAIRNMLELGLTKEQILKKYSEEDFNEAVEEGKTVMVEVMPTNGRFLMTLLIAYCVLWKI